MAQAPRTTMTYKLDGANRDFQLPFEYLARKFVQVTLVGVDRKVLTLNIDYRFTQRTIITLTKNWGPSDGYSLIEVRRYTSATERLVDFSDGSILRAYDLNTSQVQSLHIAEEGRDIATDTIGVNNDGNLDARGRKIVNVADGTGDFDAVNLRQQKQWAGSALSQADRAQREADRSTQQANASQASNAASAAQAQESLKWANESSRHAGLSKASAEASQTSNVQSFKNLQAAQAKVAEATRQAGLATSNGAAQVALATTQANRSRDEANRSTGQATASAASAGTSKTEADRSTREANRAKTEADKLGNANAFIGTILDVRNLDTRFKGTHHIKQALYVQRQSSDNVNDFVSLSFEPNSVWYTRDSSNRALASLDLSGNYASTGSITANGGSVTVRTPVESANCHYWLGGPGGNRGVIYAGTDQNIHIRGGESHVGLSVTPAGDIVTGGSIRMNGATIQANADIIADWMQGGSLYSALNSVKSGTRIKNVPVVIWERGVDTAGGVGDQGAPNSQFVLREPLMPGDFYMFEIYGAGKYYSTTNCIPYGDSTTEVHNVQFDSGGAMLFVLTEGGKRITVRAGKPNNQYGIRRVFLFKLQLA